MFVRVWVQYSQVGTIDTAGQNGNTTQEKTTETKSTNQVVKDVFLLVV